MTRFYITYIILCTFSFTTDYLWPTNASNTLTAFFGEERTRRYHAGMDIRTYGNIGHEVYAISDGYIKIMQKDYNGYGNAIYIKLRDGNTAVYAHLDKFNTKLEKISKILTKDFNSTVFHHTFSDYELTVKKGDIIGYTGDSGSISGPHLHFEIRNNDNVCLNPLINYFDIIDTQLPIPKKLAILPLGFDTKIDGQSDIRLYDIEYIQNNQYTITDTISILGEFGMALNIVDYIDLQPFNYGIYGLQLSIDGDQKYRIEFNEYNFSDASLILEERNFHLKKQTNETFYNLFSESTNSSFIDRRSWPKYHFKEGLHNFTIKAWDINKNEIIIFGTFIIEEIKNLHYKLIESSDSIIIIFEKNMQFKNYHVDICNKYDGVKTYGLSTSDNRISIDKNIINDPSNVLKIYSKTRNGLISKHTYEKVTQHNELIDFDGKFRIETFNFGATIKFEETEFISSTPKINLVLEDTTLSLQTTRIQQNIVGTDFINYRTLGKLKELQIEYDGQPINKINKKINSTLFIPNKGVYLIDDGIEIISNNKLMTDTMLFWILEHKIPKINNAKIVHGPFSLFPKNIPLMEKMEVIFTVDDKEIKGTNAGIFYLNVINNTWEYIDTKFENNIYSTKSLSNETFCLISESLPPKINQLIPDIGGTYESEDMDRLVFYIDDDLAGINGLENMSVEIDSVNILMEYNQYRKKVTCEFETLLSKGKHHLQIRAADNIGNSFSKQGYFYIK